MLQIIDLRVKTLDNNKASPPATGHMCSVISAGIQWLDQLNGLKLNSTFSE